MKNLIKKIAKKENMSEQILAKRFKNGECVIPLNKKSRISKPCGIGRGLTTKINVNLGSSPGKSNLKTELKKLEVSIKYGADTIMDLSLTNQKKIRKAILDNCPIPVGTVPIYEAAQNALKRKGTIAALEKNEILDVLEQQAQEGVDFFTIHSGITKKTVDLFMKSKRELGVVSRGGALLINWMKTNKKENPLFEYFDDVLKIAKKYNVTLSLGDGMRPGSVLDASDEAQFGELRELGKLTLTARKSGVQVIIEGPGHVPLDQIKENVEIEKKLCHNAPFYVLGPLVTDVAIGYDHISGAIGGALAAYWGADFLCFLTPSEHVRHPSVEDTKEGLIASRIAAHAADIAKKKDGAIDWDRQLSRARKKRDWEKQIELSIDPEKARKYRQSSKPSTDDVCTMCGEFCSIKIIENCQKR